LLYVNKLKLISNVFIYTGKLTENKLSFTATACVGVQYSKQAK